MKFFCCKRDFFTGKPQDLIYFDKSIINSTNNIILSSQRFIKSFQEGHRYWACKYFGCDKKEWGRYRERKITRREIYSFFCPVCGCVKVKIIDFATVLSRKLKLRVIELSGQSAQQFLKLSYDLRQSCEISKAGGFYESKTIPFVYGKAISPIEQGARYINDKGWREKHVHKSLVANVQA